MKFQPGQSGNPKGRPKGRQGKATMIAQHLLDGEAEQLVQKAIAMALAGDAVALRICLERLVPVRKNRLIDIKLPTVITLGDVGKASSTIIAAVARGELTPGEGEALGRMLERHCQTVALEDIEARLTALEKGREVE